MSSHETSMIYRAVLLFVILGVISGCSRAQQAASGVPTLPASPAAMANPSVTTLAPTTGGAGRAGLPTSTAPAGGPTSPQERLHPSVGTLKAGNSCTLVDSRDLAHLFPPHNEIIEDTPQTGPVSHPPFSQVPAAGTEQACLSYTFHQPGNKAGWMLQVTYLVDRPDPSDAPAWSQAWTAAKANSGRSISGLGDGAFSVGAKLFVKKGNTYLTFEAADTRLVAKTASDTLQLIADEKELAADALQRLQ